jgi:hypothetical protein
VDRAGNSKSPQHVMTFDPSEPASAYSPAIEQRFGKFREAQIVMTRDVIQRLVLRGRPLFLLQVVPSNLDLSRTATTQR